MFSKHAVVKVVEIRHPPDFYNPFGVNKALPKAGDRGAVVDVLFGFGKPDRYVVECVSTSGDTIWLCDFSADELLLETTQA